MKKRIQQYFLMITTLAIVATIILVCFLFYDVFRAQVFDDLKTYAHVVLYVNEGSEEDIISLIRENSGHYAEDIRLTLIDAEGNVLADNFAYAGAMTNHKDREEIKEAWEKGEGRSVRVSDTMQVSSYYYAIRVHDNMVLRVSKDSNSSYYLLLRSLPVGIAIILILWAICIMLSHFLTLMIIQPIRELAGDISNSSSVKAYEELQPFLQTIQEQHADILKSARIRQEFTANVSHELKTPLTSISGYSELIEAGMVNENDTRRFAGEIHKSSNRLLALINDILELSKLDTLSDQEVFEQVDLYDIVASCGAMLELNASKRGVSIEIEGQPTMITGSRRMIEEVVYNLCDNAIRYNKENGRLTVQVIDQTDTAVLKVIDTGIGIPKEHQERIFERFYRVDKSRSKSTGGTGLGLAIVKHILSLHKAVLELESEEGKGTCITVTFLKTLKNEA